MAKEKKEPEEIPTVYKCDAELPDVTEGKVFYSADKYPYKTKEEAERANRRWLIKQRMLALIDLKKNRLTWKHIHEDNLIRFIQDNQEELKEILK